MKKLALVVTVMLLLLLVLSLIAPLFKGSPALAGSNNSITRQFSPSADVAVTSGAGDNDGFQTTPGNAYADGGGSAEDPNSGTGDNSSATGTGTDKHNFYNYGLGVIPSGSTISGITVRADIAVDSLTNSPFTAIRLSWDGGTSWTAVKQLTLTAAAETTYTYGGSTDLWGRASWSTSELSDANFRVQVINGDTGSPNNRDFSLDWVPVSITFTAPWDSYSDSGRTTVDDAFSAPQTIVYMKGTGFDDTKTYRVAYYDGGGSKVATDTPLTPSSGVLQSEHTFVDTETSGTWYAVAQLTTATAFPATYAALAAAPDTYGLLADDSFTTDATIPELPTLLAAVAMAGLSFGTYLWMRRRAAVRIRIKP